MSDDKLTRFMQKQGYTNHQNEDPDWGNYWERDSDGVVFGPVYAARLYATVDAALELVEHGTSCETGWDIRNDCDCGADQTNALLTERRKEAGL